jgi:predicted homoserine dehydrogenase-like protein
LKTDSSGRFAAQYKPYHLIGLELGVSVATIMLRGEPTGQCKTFAADTVATAKKDLKVGETLDGEGGFMVYGKIMPAEDSLAIQGLPIGLAHGLVLKRTVAKDQRLSWDDVEFSEKTQVVAVRREMEALFRKEFAAAGAKKSNGVKAVVKPVNNVNVTVQSVTNGVH